MNNSGNGLPAKKEAFIRVFYATRWASIILAGTFLIDILIAFFLKESVIYILALFSLLALALTFGLNIVFRKKLENLIPDQPGEAFEAIHKDAIAVSTKRSMKQRMLLRQSMAQIGIGSFVIFSYPRWPGFIIGGILLGAGFVLGALYLRARINS